jgi:hypothetical protein
MRRENPCTIALLSHVRKCFVAQQTRCVLNRVFSLSRTSLSIHLLKEKLDTKVFRKALHEQSIIGRTESKPMIHMSDNNARAFVAKALVEQMQQTH